jgi:hypothetical protein
MEEKSFLAVRNRLNCDCGRLLRTMVPVAGGSQFSHSVTSVFAPFSAVDPSAIAERKKAVFATASGMGTYQDD